ncbi:MAG: O-antigen ligase family protein [bacterium]|nr:O-antigen ligase family protein [bacterium]
MAKKKRTPRQPAPATPAPAPFSLRLPSPGVVARSGLWLGTLGILFLAPFFRGLYFPAEHLTAIIVLAGLFALSWAVRATLGDPPWHWRLLDGAVLALSLTYVLSLPVAVNLRAAVGDALKFSAYLATYWLVATQAVNGRLAVLLDVLVAGAVGVVVVGLAAFTGMVEVTGAVIAGRLASSLQYPNTLAAYLSALLFLALLRREESSASPRRHLYGAAAFLLAVGMLLALSRGATLVMVPVVGLFLVALPPGRRLRPASQLALALLLGGITAGRVGQAVQQGTVLAVGGWLLGGGLVALAGGRVLDIPLRLSGKVRAIGILVGLAGLAVCATVLGRVAPALGRLVDITRTDINLLQRLVYNQDGLRIALSRPWLGAGGGGWEALYHSFQAYPYYSAYAHNFVLEHWIATGTLGLAVLILAWVAFIGLVIRAARERPERRLRLAALATASFALGLHSLIDFNLALPAIGILLFSLFGMTRALSEEGGTAAASRRPAPYPGGVTVVVVIAILAVSITAAVLLEGHLHGQRGVIALKEGLHEEARVAFERARKADPLMGSFAMDLAGCYETAAEWRRDPVLLEQARLQMQAALSREPYNSGYHHVYGVFEFGQGRIREGLYHLERSVELFPAMAPYYANLARVHVMLAVHELARGQTEAALGRARRVIELEEVATRQAALAPGFVPDSFRMAMPDSHLSLASAQAQVLLGRVEEALPVLMALAQTEHLPEAYVWTGLALELLGMDPTPFIDLVYELDPDLFAEYVELRQWLGLP